MLRGSLLCFSLLVALASTVHAAQVPFAQQDWTELTAGLNGQALSIGLGTPDNLVLRGNAFPVIVAADGTNSMMAAARAPGVSNTPGGRIVAFNKEAYMKQCGNEASPASALPCRLAVNSLRWAAAQAAVGSSVRVAVRGDAVNTAQLAAIKTAASALGITIANPSGYSTNFLSDLSALAAGAGTIADVVLTSSYTSFVGTEKAAVTSFVQQGGGLVIGGQAWSTGGNNTLYAGNQLLAPFNCIQWAGQYGDASAISVGSTAPDPTPFNADLSAQAFLDHLDGSAALPADTLGKVVSTICAAISQAPFTWATPSSSSSAARWASFGSILEAKMAAQAAAWKCGSVDGTNAANIVAAAYLAKRQSDLLPSQVVALPCSSTFPGSGASVAASATFAVNATYAGTYVGPMPPRGGTKWLSTGWWAPAGQVVTITIPSALAANLSASGGTLGVQIGSHSDNLSKKTSWCRLPYSMLQRWWFTSAAGGNTVTAASGVGGLVYIIVNWGNAFGSVEVTISGAVQAPFFFKGTTSEEQWRSSLRSLAAPWAEIGSDKFVMTVPSSVIRTLDNPQQVVDIWDKTLDGYASLASFSPDRPRAERIVSDCDISAGWMHSGYPIMIYVSAADGMLLPKYVGRDNAWGYMHELGHNHQWGAWTLPNQGETTCNLFSVWAMENIMLMNRTKRMTNRAAEQAAFISGGAFSQLDSSSGLYLLMELTEKGSIIGNYTAGWDFWRRFLKRMQEVQGTAAVATVDAQVQTWIVETSRAANKNLVEFYNAWHFPVTADTQAALAGLPPIDFNPRAPCSTCTDCCLPAELSPTLSDVCRQSIPGGWTFASYKDSASNDLGVLPSPVPSDWAALTAAAAANPWVVAINTNGWLKYAVQPYSQWTNAFTDMCRGLFLRQGANSSSNPGAYYIPSLPGTMALPSSLSIGGLCVTVPSSTFANNARPALATCTGDLSQSFKAGTGSNTNRIETVYGSAGGSPFCLDVAGSGTAAGSVVLLWSCSTNNNQKWAVDIKGRLVPRHASSMCLDTEGSSMAAGARLVINPCSNAPSQQVVAAALANCTGSPALSAGRSFSCGDSTTSGSSCSATCVDPGTFGPVTGTCVNGSWSVTGTCTVKGSLDIPGAIKLSSYCADVYQGNFFSGQKVTTYGCTGGINQQWKAGSGDNRLRIETVKNGTASVPFCLDVSGAATAAGSPIVITTCSSVASQKWTLDASQRMAAGHVQGMCLDTAGSKVGSGIALVINPCSSATSQVFNTQPLANCTTNPTINNGAFTCSATQTSKTCQGSCSTGYSGTPLAYCWNGKYTVSGSCSASRQASPGRRLMV